MRFKRIVSPGLISCHMFCSVPAIEPPQGLTTTDPVTQQSSGALEKVYSLLEQSSESDSVPDNDHGHALGDDGQFATSPQESPILKPTRHKDTSNGLFLAALNGEVSAVEQILSKSQAYLDSFHPDQWTTPLMVATINGHIEVVKQLVEAGADLELMDSFGYTALTLATMRGHSDIVTYLVEKGANPNHGGLGPSSPRGWAKRKRYDEITTILESKGKKLKVE